ncbi:MAG: hypothetical protein J5965_10795 [Aeriscardovia sp.]|nr:hypothetical protein [Aeriscardovia sp.]
MAKWRVHPTCPSCRSPPRRYKSWQKGGYIQQAGDALRFESRCKSWQNGGYIQHAHEYQGRRFSCKSWQMENTST